MEEISILGIAFAAMLIIMAFSAIILYLAFRIRETFREEKGLRFQMAKTGFLLGVLFLAAGIFYFFASVLQASESPKNQTPEITVTTPIVPRPITIQPTPTDISLDLDYPSQVGTAESFTLTFAITNPTEEYLDEITLTSGYLLSSLEAIYSTHRIDSNSLLIDTIPPGSTTGIIKFRAPRNPTVIDDDLLLESPHINPIAKPVKIKVAKQWTSRRLWDEIRS